MAYVINPDGTIKVLEVEYDRYGHIRPKINGTVDNRKSSVSSTSKRSKRKKKKKHHKYPTALMPSANKNIVKAAPTPYSEDKCSSPETTTPISTPSNDSVVERATPVIKYAPQTPAKKKIFQTKEAIDEYFTQRKELRQVVHREILEYAIKHLNHDLSAYFIKCFNEHNDFCRSKGWGTKEPEWKPKKKRKEAAFTPEKTSSSGKLGNSRHPVYGYARDRYGRVQERDSLNEERKNEFKQSQSLQRKYDYSSYDSENDHDSYYDSISYD